MKPPYGVISAINLDRGDIQWQVPYGETPDAVRNNPALKGMNIGNTGQSGSVGLVVTKTLVVLGDSQTDLRSASARRDAARLRQSHRQRSRRGLDARSAKRLANDLLSTASSTSSSPSAAAHTPANTSPIVSRQPNRIDGSNSKALGERLCSRGLSRVIVKLEHEN